MKAVVMIPARSGSEGLKDKNILELDGMPMIAHSIIPAKKCKLINSVYLNSDSDKYLEIGEYFGAIRYKRHLGLSSNNVTMKSVVEDFCKYIKQEDHEVDCVVILYPTYPFRTASDIESFVTTFRSLGGERSIVGLKYPDTHPCLIYNRSVNGGIDLLFNQKCKDLYRRQDYPEVFELSHWACVVPVNFIENLNHQLIDELTYGYLIRKDKIIIDVDSEEELFYAQYLVEKKRL